MGDAGFETEARLLREGGDLHADFLKVGHHGSAYASSAEFLAAVYPYVAVISVGRHNDFGHPTPRTLTALYNVGARIYRTDRCGAVTYPVGENLIHQSSKQVDVSTMIECAESIHFP
jgi:competence protein ComEC